MGALFGLSEVVLGAPANHHLAMFDEFREDFLETEHARLDAVDEGQHVVVE